MIRDLKSSPDMEFETNGGGEKSSHARAFCMEPPRIFG